LFLLIQNQPIRRYETLKPRAQKSCKNNGKTLESYFFSSSLEPLFFYVLKTYADSAFL
jgi:hypothetical protein